MRRELAVDLDLHGIEAKIIVVFDGDEQRHLCIGRIQQALFEIAEFGGDAEHIGFNLLDLAVQTAHIVPGYVLRHTRRERAAGEEEQHQRAD